MTISKPKRTVEPNRCTCLAHLPMSDSNQVPQCRIPFFSVLMASFRANLPGVPVQKAITKAPQLSSWKTIGPNTDNAAVKRGCRLRSRIHSCRQGSAHPEQNLSHLQPQSPLCSRQALPTLMNCFSKASLFSPSLRMLADNLGDNLGYLRCLRRCH